MKIQQEQLPFRPITIKLEKCKEASSFIGLIDKVDAHITHGDSISLTSEEKHILIDISNSFTDLVGLR